MEIISALWIMLFTAIVVVIRKKNILFLPIGIQMLLSSIFLIAADLNPQNEHYVVFFIFMFIISVSVILYIYCLAAMMLKRRSTLNIDELTELRG